MLRRAEPAMRRDLGEREVIVAIQLPQRRIVQLPPGAEVEFALARRERGRPQQMEESQIGLALTESLQIGKRARQRGIVCARCGRITRG